LFFLRNIEKAILTEGTSVSVAWDDGETEIFDLSELNAKDGFPLGKEFIPTTVAVSSDQQSLKINENAYIPSSSLHSIGEGKDIEYTQFGLWNAGVRSISYIIAHHQGGYLPMEVPSFFNVQFCEEEHHHVWYAVESALAAHHKLNISSPLFEAIELCKKKKVPPPDRLINATQNILVDYHQGTSNPTEDRKRFTSYCENYDRWRAVWGEQFIGKNIDVLFGGKQTKEFKAFLKRISKMENKLFVKRDLIQDRLIKHDPESAAERAKDAGELLGKESTARKKLAPFHKEYSHKGWIYVPNPTLLKHLNTKGTPTAHNLSGAYGRWLPSPWVLISIPLCWRIMSNEIKRKGMVPGKSHEEACEHIKQLDIYKKERLGKSWPDEMSLGLSIAMRIIKPANQVLR